MLGGRVPKTSRAEFADHDGLVASRMAVDEDLAVVGVPDRKAWVSILMGGARRHPVAAGAASPKGAGKGLGVHASPAPLAFFSEPWRPS